MRKYITFENLFAVMVILGFILAAGWASAQSLCEDRNTVTQRLVTKFDEHYWGAGLATGDVSVFEVWVSTDNSTWTILRTTTDGQTCLMMQGTNWRVPLKGRQDEKHLDEEG